MRCAAHWHVRRLSQQRGLHNRPHLGELLKRRVVEKKKKLPVEAPVRGGVLVHRISIADLLRDDAHDLKHLEGRP